MTNEELYEKLRADFNGVNSRLDHMESRLDGVENRLVKLEEKVQNTGLYIENEVNVQMNALADKQTLMEGRIIREIDNRVKMLYTPLDKRVTAVELGVNELNLKAG